jgi:hypothetical protein
VERLHEMKNTKKSEGAMDEKDKFIVKSYNTKELAQHYRLSPKAFRTWLKPLKPYIGMRIGNYYTAEQVKVIIVHLGKPDSSL